VTVLLTWTAALCAAKSVSVRTDVPHGSFEYLTKFAWGVGTGLVEFRFSESVIDRGFTLVFIMDENWQEAISDKSCETQLRAAVEGRRGYLSHHLSTPDMMMLGPTVMPFERDSSSNLRFSPWKTQEISHTIRPHYWYAVLMNCHNSTHRHAPVHYDMKFTQEGGAHESQDEYGMFSWALVCFFISSVVGFFVTKRLRLRRKDGRTRGGMFGHFHPVIEALLLAMLLHYLSLILQLMHYLAYSSNGNGWSLFPMQTLSTICHEASKLALSTLFIVISQGWTITTDKVPNRDTLVPIVAATSAFELLGVVVQVLYNDSHDAFSSRAREGLTGFGLVVVQLVLYYWFLSGVKKCISTESKQMSARHGFFLAFAFCCSLWFLSEPFLVLLSIVFSEYYRQALLCGGSLFLQTVALSLLSRLFLWRSLYFKISSLSDSVLPGAGRGSTGAKDI